MKKEFLFSTIVVLIAAIIVILLRFLSVHRGVQTAVVVLALIIALVKVLNENQGKEENAPKLVVSIIVEFVIVFGGTNFINFFENPFGMHAEAPHKAQIQTADNSDAQDTDLVPRINEDALTYYGVKFWKSICAAKKTMPVGEIKRFIFSTDNQLFARKLNLTTNGIIRISISKDVEDKATDTYTDDWEISIVQDTKVLYKSIINRKDEKADFFFKLDQGNYLFVIKRLVENTTHRVINVESTFLAM